ncbi:MAG: pitrilysin family protein [Armatimonadota bacterium]|nr:pitrilysin family protein [Armatimonadota bacterium]
MQRFLLITFALVSLLAPACRAQFGMPTVTKMGNGLTVILLEDHSSELVAVDVWVRAGSANETPKNNGVSHFIEHLIFGSTLKRRAGDMDLEMESVGGVLNARTSRDWAHFYTTVSSRYLSKALDVLADALMNAQFPEHEIQRERLILLDEISRLETDPVEVCKTAIASAVFGAHPYGLPIQGTTDSIKMITRDDIISYYHQYYTPNNTAIVIVGDIEPQKALSEVGKAFQGWSNPAQQPTKFQDVELPSRQTVKRVESPFKNAYITIGFLGPRGSDYQDVCAVDVLLSYLGYGYRSWLEEEIMNKLALADAVSADFLTQRERGMITIFAATTPANLEKVQSLVMEKIVDIRTRGIPEASISLAKRSLLGRYAFQNETVEGMANSFGFYFAVSEPQFAVTYIGCVQSITNEDVIRAAQKYLDPERAIILILAPKEGGAQ